MNWFNAFSVRSKLVAGFAVVVVLLAVVVTTAFQGLSSLEKSQATLYEANFGNVYDLMALRTNFNAERVAVLTMLQVDSSQWGPWKKDINERIKDNDEILDRLLEHFRDDPFAYGKINELHTLRTDFTDTLMKEELQFISEGKVEELKKLAIGIQNERHEKIRALTHEVEDYETAKAQKLVKDTEKSTQSYLVSFALLGGAAVVVALLLAAFLNRAIARYIIERNQMEARVKERSTRLENVLQEAQEAVGVLTSSSSEILTAIAQLASGASEAASAVSETTTTVEEVRQTAQLSNQKAKDIAEAGQNAAKVLQAGQKNVEASVSEMSHIRDQMGSIAETIVTLSEQSQAIGEITGTVNELAEQSNLLAVNAAIEAAQAGEQGKGFAVVAQEIKSLAEQSKQATGQVRALLADIQKAISNAVMATEQASKVVETGVAQSSQAGESIRSAVDATANVARASTQIAASSQQQLIGVDQVATAMENINQASIQNAQTTKQVETVAQNLHELSQKLQSLVEQTPA